MESLDAWRAENEICDQPDELKGYCPVWVGGKGEDYLKTLPINMAICQGSSLKVCFGGT